MPGARREACEIEVALLYQSIGYRWAQNLAAYDSPEPQRFVRYYAESAADSAITLAAARAAVARPVSATGFRDASVQRSA